MFWTQESAFGLPEVTLCEHHALEGTNMAMQVVGDPSFGSMAEASAILGALFALGGQDLGITASETGVCGACQDEAAANALSERESA